ncbi:Uncharacterized protein FWK35_00033506, partial [Aphis craccivora]
NVRVELKIVLYMLEQVDGFALFPSFIFFVSVFTRTCRNNASISNFGVGALGRSLFEFPNNFQKRREKPKKKLRKNGNH